MHPEHCVLGGGNNPSNGEMASVHSLFWFLYGLGGSAHDFAQRHKRSTIQPEDLLNAVEEVEFEGFREILEQMLQGVVELRT